MKDGAYRPNNDNGLRRRHGVVRPRPQLSLIHTGNGTDSGDGDEKEPDIRVTVAVFKRASTRATAQHFQHVAAGGEDWLDSQAAASKHESQVRRLMTHMFTLIHAAPDTFFGMVLRAEVARKASLMFDGTAKTVMLGDMPVEIELPADHQVLEKTRSDITARTLALVAEMANSFARAPGG